MASEVASAFVSLIPSFRGGQAAIAKELGAVGGTAGDAAGKTTGKRMGGAILGSLKGFVGPMAGIFGAVAGLNFLKGTVQDASDLNETVSKSQQIFGPAFGQLDKWARTAATSVGLSRSEALAATAVFGDMFQQLGQSGPEAARTSQKVVQLAADLGSFHNLDTAEVNDLISASFRGEYDSIQRIIPGINAARVEKEALARTGKDNAKALTAEEKAMATLAIIQKDSAKAQGDFARTSGSLANQQKILSAQWQDAKTQLGNALLPVVTSVVSQFNKWMPTISRIAKQVGQVLGPAIEGVVGFIGDLFSAGGGGGAGAGILSFFKSLGDAAKIVGPAIGGFVQKLLPTLQELGSKIMGVLGPGLASIGKIIKEDVAPAFAVFLTAAAPVAKFLIGVFGTAVVGALKGAVNVIRGALQIIAGLFKVFAGILTGDWSRVWEGIKQIGQGIWDAIKGAFQIFINVGIGKAFSLGAKAITGIGRSLWTSLKGLFTAGANAVKSTNQALINAVVGFFKALPGRALGALSRLGSMLAGVFRSAWSAAQRAVSSAASTMVSFVKGLPGRIKSGLGRMGSLLVSAGRDLVQGLINGIRNMAGAAVRAAKNVVGDAISGAKALLGIGSPSKVFREFGVNLGEGFVLGMESQRKSVGKAAKVLAGEAQLGGGLGGDLAGRIPRPRTPFATATAGIAAGERTYNIEVKAFSDRFSLRQVQDELALHGVA